MPNLNTSILAVCPFVVPPPRQQRAIETAEVIEELIALARDMREADARGEVLRGIARELVAAVRSNVTIDWTLRENVCAKLRVLVKRVLKKHGYPPDKREKATLTVLEQAELLSGDWATSQAEPREGQSEL